MEEAMEEWIGLWPSLGGNVAVIFLVGLIVRHWFTTVNKRLDEMPENFRAETEKTHKEFGGELKEIRSDIRAIQVGMARSESAVGMVNGMRQDVKNIEKEGWRHASQIEALFRAMDRYHLTTQRASDDGH